MSRRGPKAAIMDWEAAATGRFGAEEASSGHSRLGRPLAELAGRSTGVPWVSVEAPVGPERHISAFWGIARRQRNRRHSGEILNGFVRGGLGGAAGANVPGPRSFFRCACSQVRSPPKADGVPFLGFSRHSLPGTPLRFVPYYHSR
jgi:hypothetical protein